MCGDDGTGDGAGCHLNMYVCFFGVCVCVCVGARASALAFAFRENYVNRSPHLDYYNDMAMKFNILALGLFRFAALSLI